MPALLKWAQATPPGCPEGTQPFHLGVQSDGVALHHALLDQGDQQVNVPCAGGAGIHDEVGMDRRNLGAPNGEALEAKPFDELSCFLRFGVAKDAAAAGLLVGLAAGSAVEIGAGALAQGFRVVARREPQARREDHQGLVLEATVAIGKVQPWPDGGFGWAGWGPPR